MNTIFDYSLVNTFFVFRETVHKTTNTAAIIKDLYPGKFHLNPKDLCTRDPHKVPVDLIIAVLSAVSNFEPRKAIRSTWGNLTNFPNVRFAFIVGDSTDAALLNAIREESRIHGDLVQTSIVDSWKNLTLKHVAMLDFVVHNCMDAKFYMKTDDDAYFNLTRVLELLRAVEAGGPAVAKKIRGLVFRNTTIPRDPHSKYYVPYSAYNQTSTFPDFCHGGGYFMQTELAARLFGQLMKSTHMPSDDAFVTGVLAKKLGIERVDVPNWMRDFDHGVKPQDMVEKRIYGTWNIRPDSVYEFWKFANQH